MDDIESDIIELAAEHFCVPENCIEPSSSFYSDLGADTLDVVEFVIALEDEFGIAISGDDSDSLETVGEAVSLVERLLKERE